MATQNRATDFPGDSNLTNALPPAPTAPTPAALQEKIATLEMVTKTLNTFLESGNCIEASKHLLSFALHQTPSRNVYAKPVIASWIRKIPTMPWNSPAMRDAPSTCF